MKAFYDYGNEANSLIYDVFTLASVFGTKDEWKPFERDWREALKGNKNAPYLHTTDALAKIPRGPYVGWTKPEIDKLLTDCVAVIARHIAIRITAHNPGRMGLGVNTQTINLKDYKRAKSFKPDLPPVTEICATNAIVRTLEWKEAVNMVETRADFIHMIFDQNEPFFGHVEDRFKNKKAHKALPDLDCISSRTEADMRDQPALQMADVIAWSCNHSQVRYRWKNRLMSFKWIRDDFNYDGLVNPRQDSIDLVKTWRLPPRGAIK
jgi:hypothetical protein